MKGDTSRCNYDPKTLGKAVNNNKRSKLSYRRAAELYEIPNKVNKIHPKKVGRSISVEYRRKDAGAWHYQGCALGFSFHKNGHKLKGYLDNCGRKRFPNNLQGVDWAQSFLDRHSQTLPVLLSEKLKGPVQKLVKQLLGTIHSIKPFLENLPPNNIINNDQTNMSDDPGKQQIIVKRGNKHAEKMIDSSKTSISIMMATTGDGTLLPPYVLFNSNKRGWFDLPVFED